MYQHVVLKNNEGRKIDANAILRHKTNKQVTGTTTHCCSFYTFKMKIQQCLVHCCYTVVGLVLLASTPTSAEKIDQIQNSVGMSIAGGGVVAGLHGAAIMRGIQQQKVKINGKMRPAMEAFDYLAGLSR